MSKRNTVQINMEVFDNWLKESDYKSPKEFCEKELGLSDGWYYGIRKNDGKGVKVLLANLIASHMGVKAEKLIVSDRAVSTEETAKQKYQIPDGYALINIDHLNSIKNAIRDTKYFLQREAAIFEELYNLLATTEV